MTADTTTLHEDPHALTAEEPAPKGNWTLVFAPNGTIEVAPTPSSEAPQFLEWHRDLFRNIPADADQEGILGMGRGGGTLMIYLYKGATPTKCELRKLTPFILSRWSARIHTYGECRYEENFPGLFGLKDEPAIIRTGPEIGDALARSCTGKQIHYSIRADGLRCGRSDDPRFGISSLAGFVEFAEPDAHGVVATLLVLSPSLHWDLENLDAAGQLESARLCLSHSARAVPRQTGWGLSVFDCTHVAADHLNVTSLAHSPGTFVLRRLAIDESLSLADFQVGERLHVPRELSASKSSSVVSWPPAPARNEPDHVATINPGAVNERVAASGTSTVNTTSGTTADIPDMSQSVTTVAGDLVIVTLRMREIKIENLSASPQNVTAFLEITDASNNVVNGDADDHWTFPLSAAGGGAAFVVVPVNIVAFDSPGTGTQTYKGRWRVSGSVDSNVKVTNANSRRLQAIRTKR